MSITVTEPQSGTIEEGHEPDAEPDAGQQDENDSDENNEEEDDGSDEEDDVEDDEAEAIARRLTDQLWADINRAHADRASGAPSTAPKPVPETASTTNKGTAAIATMKTVLAFAAADAQVYATLSSTKVPGVDGITVLELLRRTVHAGTVARDVAGPLSQILVTLARSETLFPPLPPLPPGFHAGKRKREDGDVEDGPAPKRVAGAGQELHIQLIEAIRVITEALSRSPAHEAPLDPSVIASIQLQLHQVFLFAVTSSAGQHMSVLQEISGLIQVLGVLSGTQIAPSAPPLPENHGAPYPQPADEATPWLHHAAQSQQSSDIGTAVYPCLLTGCQKVFSRLYSLRQHQRAHSVHRPFKCHQCPASFARNHDLKRHVKGHDKRAFRCCGCGKVFSRRDAIKRHRGGPKKITACSAAETEEVEWENQGGELRTGNRARNWSGVTPAPNAVGEDGLEEGELQHEVVAGAQAAVSNLHSLLRGHVANALGTSGIPAVPASLAGSDTGQATLASVIARATAAANAAAYSCGILPPTTDAPMACLPPPEEKAPETSVASLSNYGLSEDQAKLLETAIANATAAAQAQAEAEAMLEEEEEQDDADDDLDEPEDDEPDEPV